MAFAYVRRVSASAAGKLADADSGRKFRTFLGAFVDPLKDIISAVSQFLPSQV